MKKWLMLFAAALFMLLSASALAVSGECTYYSQNGDHSWNQIEVGMPGCTEDGYYVLKCTVCGTTKKEITGEAYGHTWEKTKVVEATCTEAGYIEYTCSECGEKEPEDVMPYGHYWVKSAEVAGTCTHPSYIHYKCANGCGDTKTDTIKVPGHDWKDLYELQPATCTLAGSMKTECKVCGEVGTRIAEIIPHEYGEWIVTKDVDNGMCVRIRSCIMCGKQEAEEFYPEGTLYRGISAKQAVKDLQTMLVDCGYLNDKIDGVFGKKTEQAVKDFQKKNNIGADGIAWPQTIRLLSTEWERLMGISATPTPTAAPTAVPTPEPTVAATIAPEHISCTIIVNEDGSEEIAYCENHSILMEMCDALLAAASTDSSRIRALNQSRNLWTEEVNLLYETWMTASEEADKATIAEGKAMFESYLASQEAIWKIQYRNKPGTVAEKVNELLVDQCVSLCGMISGFSGEQVSTEKGYVSVGLVDGWYLGESTSNDAIILYNDAVGSNTSTWVTITDSQMNGIEQAKQIAKFAYVGGEFSEIEIGVNSFYYIANDDGTVFSLIAETSTGKSIKIDGRNCTVDQAMLMLETIEIY